MADGWVCVHRSLLDHGLWSSDPFGRGQAWVDLIMLANWESREIWFDGEPLTIQRGQFLTSETKLAQRWMWSRKKVHAFLLSLEKGAMIAQQKHGKGTLISLINFEQYQSRGQAEEREKSSKGTAEEQQKHITGTAEEPQKSTTNNLTTKQLQQENKGEGTRVYFVDLEFIKLTLPEFQSFAINHLRGDEAKAWEHIEDANRYLDSWKGERPRNSLSYLVSWLKKDSQIKYRSKSVTHKKADEMQSKLEILKGGL